MNYQKKLEKTLDEIREGKDVPRLLLHSCCAPCSSYVLEYLTEFFDISVFYFNPNIYPENEYEFRINEQLRLIKSISRVHNIELIEGDYHPEEFFDIAKGYESCPEGGDRCRRCYKLRLEKAAAVAREKGMDYFTTTLTISPLKNSAVINDLGVKLSEEYGVKYLESDFKKREGYKRSLELSKEYNLYRQNYCGCIYSLR